MTKKIIPPGDYYLGEIKQNNYAAGQTAFIFLPGQGESLPFLNLADQVKGREDATQTVIDRVCSWGSGGASFSAAADVNGFNLITLSPRLRYESGEIWAAIHYAVNVLKASKVVIVVWSLGGYGLMTQISADANLAKSIYGVVWIAPGPGTTTNTAKNIAAAGFQNWFFTCENDTISGTSPQVAINLHKAIVAAGGKSYLTAYKKGQFSDANAHQIYFQIIPAWFKPKAPGNFMLGGLTTTPFTTATPLGEAGIPNLITDPKMSIYDFLGHCDNSKSITPGKTVAEQTTTAAPAPTAATTGTPSAPTTTTATAAADDADLIAVNLMGDDKLKAHSIVDVDWSDGKEKKRYDSTGDMGRLQGAYVNFKLGNLVKLNYKDANKEVQVGPTRSGGKKKFALPLHTDKVYLVAANLMGDDAQSAHSIVDVDWSDGSKQRFDSSGPNGRLQGAYINFQLGNVVKLNYKDKNIQVTIGPYK